MIYWYKEYVLKTSEQRKKEKLLRQHRARQTLLMLGVINSLCDEISGNF